jgi:histidine ammonia-lyase
MVQILLSFRYQWLQTEHQISKKLEHIISIELMLAVQALDFHRPLKSSPAIGAVYRIIRKQVPTLKEDRLLYPDMCYIHHLIAEGEIVNVVEEVIGQMIL